jgi:hypothetical protein
MPRGTFHCPADFGGGYHLAFAAAGGRALPPVSLQVGGCEQVHGAGPVRWLSRTPGFWSTFATSTGITVGRHVP